MSRRLLALLMLALLALPPVLAHGEMPHTSSGEHAEPAPVEVAPSDGYTGPGREPYVSYVHGVWVYGQASLTPLAQHSPRGMVGDGDWLVWEDSKRSDIFLYNIPAGQGYYLTNDSSSQRNPHISGNIVVWEDYRDFNRADIYAHFIETSETRRITTSEGNHRRPSIHGELIAFELEVGSRQDIGAFSLANNTEWVVSDAPDRESDPLALEGRVFWRTYRYNLWDVTGHDVRLDRPLQLSSDPEIQGAPFSNGRDVFYLTQHLLGWDLIRYDLEDDRNSLTPLKMSSTARTPASGQHLLYVSRDGGYSQLVARNLSSGESTHVTGSLVLEGDPWLIGRTAYAPLRTPNGTSLLALDISPFAFSAPPRLSIVSPGGIAPWVRPVIVDGVLKAGEGWAEPVTFTYRVDDGPPQVIVPGERWRFTLDNAGVDEGAHEVVVRATFREGPPVEASITLVVPSAQQAVDVEREGPAYHAARVLGEFNFYVLDNPAAWVLIPLLVVLLALVLVRVWIWLWPKRRRQPLVEYVVPDEA